MVEAERPGEDAGPQLVVCLRLGAMEQHNTELLFVSWPTEFEDALE